MCDEVELELPPGYDLPKRKLPVKESDPEIVQYIQEKINSHKVVIFSKTYCTQSKLTKHIFHEVDHIYHAVELDKLNCGFEMLLELAKMTENDHCPYVYVKGKYIGGGLDLDSLHDIDKIREMLDLPPPPMYTQTKVPWVDYGKVEGLEQNQVPFSKDLSSIQRDELYT